MVCAVAVMCLLCGCARRDNFLENANFQKWKNMPEGWSLEGEATVKKAGANGVELYSKAGGTPFLYQRIKLGRGNRGRPLTLAAWVKSDSPGGAVIEYSDRKGNDVKSGAHPGDGEWRLLKVIVRAPETLDTVEFRIRNYRAGATSVKDPQVTTRSVMSDDQGAVAGYDFAGAYRTSGIIALSGLILATIIYFRQTKATANTGLMEAFIILVMLADMMLMLQRPLNSEVTSNMAWAVFVILAARLAMSRFKKTGGWKRGRIIKPKAILIMLSIFFAVLAVNAIRSGSQADAEKNAGRAFAAMMLGAGVIAFSKLIPKKSANMEVLKNLRERRPDAEEPAFSIKDIGGAVSGSCGVSLKKDEPGRNGR